MATDLTMVHLENIVVRLHRYRYNYCLYSTICGERRFATGIAAGAPESTVMAISGRKTRWMIERYPIIKAADIQRAAALRTRSQNSPEKLGGDWGRASLKT